MNRSIPDWFKWIDQIDHIHIKGNCPTDLFLLIYTKVFESCSVKSCNLSTTKVHDLHGLKYDVISDLAGTINSWFYDP